MTDLTLTRIVPASPERVWLAWTTADELAGWFWPASWETTCELDLRVGGRYRIASQVSGIGLSGEYVAVERPSRLVQTFQWDGDDYETLVTVSFLPVNGGTELTIVHERFLSNDEAQNHIQGWNDCIDRLVLVDRS